MEIKDRFVKPKSTIHIFEHSAFAKENLICATYAGDYYCAKGYEISRKELQTFLLFWVQEGSLVMETQGKQWVVKSGELFLLDCRDAHRYYAVEDTHFCWCHFGGGNSEAYFRLFQEKYKNAMSGNYFVEQNNSCQMLFECLIKKCCSEHRVNMKFLDLFTNLVDRNEKDNNTQERIMLDAKAYIRSNLMEDISLQTLSDRVCMSPYHFARIFKRVTGTSPYEYLLQIRIENAKKLLLLSGLSVEEIAGKCGFHSGSHFIRIFKSRVGMTPYQFRTTKF